VCLNLFSNVGTVDDADIPSIAYETVRRGDREGSLRRHVTAINRSGLKCSASQVAGARTKPIAADLGGGFRGR